MSCNIMLLIEGVVSVYYVTSQQHCRLDWLVLNNETHVLVYLCMS